MKPLDESDHWISQLNDKMSFIRLEKDSLCISKTCERARMLQNTLAGGSSSISEILDMVYELMKLDNEVVSCRQKPEWPCKILNVSDLPPFYPSIQSLTSTVQLHPDLRIAYEWNYHRAARIIVHQQILKCLEAVVESLSPDNVANEALQFLVGKFTETIRADEVLSTVPQSFGDIDSLGRLHND